ncbi:ATP-binding cassette domain-containing protein [Pseudonocardia kunmingensis]|uniref:Branched-chain amino acid transport system ATP-binding protein n=1 Tax=Pseudonocardia kunmingensis TaxID=630975 RepID=A0A543DP35_9PSEU|nr:ATP-binding cassette domain-containing protein [Pseudonocardia kunmingensis]TQM11078.1 branched-chain amino acid transport system ATP-binding protein [Pseudonocardia kunmingensis]
MSATMAGLVVDDLRAGYGRAEVLHGASLRVASGELVGVAGPNGVGKTTLLRAISGTITRGGGDVAFDSAPLPADPAAVAARGVTHVPEGRRLFPNLTVEENLRVGALGGRVRDYPTSRADVLALLPGLEPLLERRAGVLSGGQQQLVAVARGLVARPRLLLLDELSLGLSPRAVREVSEATVASCRDLGTGVLWVDQNVGLLARLCDRVMLLRSGAVEELPPGAEADLGALYF